MYQVCAALTTPSATAGLYAHDLYRYKNLTFTRCRHQHRRGTHYLAQLQGFLGLSAGKRSTFNLSGIHTAVTLAMAVTPHRVCVTDSLNEIKTRNIDNDLYFSSQPPSRRRHPLASLMTTSWLKEGNLMRPSLPPPPFTPALLSAPHPSAPSLRRTSYPSFRPQCPPPSLGRIPPSFLPHPSPSHFSSTLPRKM